MISHCERRLKKSTFNFLKQAHSEGVETPGLNEYLKQGLYNPVLCAVWGEGKLKRRVEWLRSNADLHAPLMFELAIAEFEDEPTIQKILDVCVPLINAASLRVHQDIVCLEGDVEKKELHHAMYEIYMEVLAHKVKKYLSLVDINKLMLEQRGRILKHTKGLFIDIQNRTLSQPETLPSPVWISYALEGWQQPMKSSSEFNLIRQKFMVYSTSS